MKIVIEAKEKEVLAVMMDNDEIKNLSVAQREQTEDVEMAIRLAFAKLFNPETNGIVNIDIQEETNQLCCVDVSNQDMLIAFASIAQCLIDERGIDPVVLINLLGEIGLDSIKKGMKHD